MAGIIIISIVGALCVGGIIWAGIMCPMSSVPRMPSAPKPPRMPSAPKPRKLHPVVELRCNNPRVETARRRHARPTSTTY